MLDAHDRARFDEAQLAIDAMAAVINAVGDRLGENASPLRDALLQLQTAFVQRKDESSAG